MKPVQMKTMSITVQYSKIIEETIAVGIVVLCCIDAEKDNIYNHFEHNPTFI